MTNSPQGIQNTGLTPDELRAVETVAAAFPDTKVTIHEVFGSPGRAEVRAEITATHTGEWFGVPATGRRFTLALHEFHHIRTGV